MEAWTFAAHTEAQPCSEDPAARVLLRQAFLCVWDRCSRTRCTGIVIRAESPSTESAAAGEVSGLLDPVASAKQRLFEQHARSPGDTALGIQYQGINERHFHGLLPTIRIVWEPSLRDIAALVGPTFQLNGMTDGRLMFLNSDLQRNRADLTRALCHEMVHVQLIQSGDSKTNHGPPFQATLRRLLEENAFEAIWATDGQKLTLREWIDRESAH